MQRGIKGKIRNSQWMVTGFKKGRHMFEGKHGGNPNTIKPLSTGSPKQKKSKNKNLNFPQSIGRPRTHMQHLAGTEQGHQGLEITVTLKSTGETG